MSRHEINRGLAFFHLLGPNDASATSKFEPGDAENSVSSPTKKGRSRLDVSRILPKRSPSSTVLVRCDLLPATARKGNLTFTPEHMMSDVMVRWRGKQGSTQSWNT